MTTIIIYLFLKSQWNICIMYTRESDNNFMEFLEIWCFILQICFLLQLILQTIGNPYNNNYEYNNFVIVP